MEEKKCPVFLSEKTILFNCCCNQRCIAPDVIVVVIKDALPQMPLERSEVIRAVIVRTCKEFKCEDGIIIRYDDNAMVIIDKKGNPKGTRVFGAIAEAAGSSLVSPELGFNEWRNSYFLSMKKGAGSKFKYP
ncbi:hypothetical protein ZWY2020_040952 [Hordeum vulgare]|nr:hypothetical protein ZWY2020_040952 [Hordeum vulgare]